MKAVYNNKQANCSKPQNEGSKNKAKGEAHDGKSRKVFKRSKYILSGNG